MPVIQDQELLYTLLSEGRLDLMYLPAGAIAWLWKDERPEEQVNAATQLGIAAKDINPITDASILKSDKNILILKCEDGQTFRVYPGGGYSRGGEEMMDIQGCVEVMQDVGQGKVPEIGSPCDNTDIVGDAITGSLVDVVVASDNDGYDHMASPMPPEEVITGGPVKYDHMASPMPPMPPEEVIMGGPVKLEDLLRRATEIEMDEESGDQPRAGQYYSYDELTNGEASDIQAHSGEDMDDCGCDQNLEGQEFCDHEALPHDHHYDEDTPDEERYSVTSETFDFDFDKDKTTENAGGAAATSAPIGTGMFDTEDDIAGGVMMQFEDES